MTEKRFVFNERGVCTNPNEITFNCGKCEYILKTASDNHCWMVGYTFRISCDACISPCKKGYDDFFHSERDALKYAAQKAMAFFKEKHCANCNTERYASVPNEILNNLQNIITPQPVQLTLFDDL